MTWWRGACLLAMGLPLAWLGGCASPPAARQGTRAAGIDHCHHVLGIGTCVQGPATTSVDLASVRRLLPRADAARIVVVRSKMQDWIGQVRVTLDGQPLQDTMPCSAFAVDVSAGEHRLALLPGLSGGEATVRVARGELLMLALRAMPADPAKGIRRAYGLQRIDRAEARAGIEGCRLLGLHDRTAPASSN